MILNEFLVKYDFSEEQKDFITADFNRGPKSRRKLTTKQLLVNKKFTVAKGEKTAYSRDLYTIVPKSTVCSWKLEYSIVTSNDYLNHKTKSYDCALPVLEKQLTEHIHRLQEYMGGFLASKAIAQEASILFNKLLKQGIYQEKDRIQFSDGWVQRYVHRNELLYLKGHGERDSVDVNSAKDQVIKMIEATDLSNFGEDDIFNMDETGLDWRTIFKQGYCVGDAKRIKVSKERITALVGTNMTGSEKLPLFIIGKSKQPRGFPTKIQDEYANKYILFYRNNQSAWMTVDFFKEYLAYLNEYFKRNNRNVAVIVDGPQVHQLGKKNKETNQLIVQPYTNISVFYFNANITSVVQPMDQGVILSFKCAYRRLLSQSLISKTRQIMDRDDQIKTQSGVEIVPSLSNFKINKFISFPEAIEFAIQSWNYVPKSVIQNAWIESTIPAVVSINKWHKCSVLDSAVLTDEQMILDFKLLNICNDIANIDILRDSWYNCDNCDTIEEAKERIENENKFNTDKSDLLRTSPETGDISSDQLESIHELLKVPSDLAYRE